MAFKFPVRKGEGHPMSKLSDMDRFECRGRYLAKEATISQLAGEKGVAPSTMHRTCHDPAWNASRRPLDKS